MSTTITALIAQTKNHTKAIAEILADPIQTEKPFVWMLDTTPDVQLAARSGQIAKHAARILEINKAIYALSQGQTVTETALGDFQIA